MKLNAKKEMRWHGAYISTKILGDPLSTPTPGNKGDD
jgi:hypothetical protein